MIRSLGRVCLGRLVLIGHRELRAEEEVADGVLVEDAVDQDSLLVALEVDAVVAATEAVKRAAVPLDSAEIFPVERTKIIGKDLELGEEVELEILGKGAHFRGADGIEDDLEHGKEAK